MSDKPKLISAWDYLRLQGVPAETVDRAEAIGKALDAIMDPCPSCENKAGEEHTCPLAEEVYCDEGICRCCPECEAKCRDSI